MIRYARTSRFSLVPVAIVAACFGAASQPAHAQFLISNFNGVGPRVAAP